MEGGDPSLLIHIECWDQFWAPPYKTDIDSTEERPVKHNKALEHLSYKEEELGDLGLCSLERRRLGKILSMSLNTRWEEIKGTETDFSLVSSDRKRGNGHKIKYNKCCLNIK